MAELKSKSQNPNLKILLAVALILLGIFVFKFRRAPGDVKQEPIVRDEFIDELVEQAEHPYPLVVTGRKYYEQGELERARQLFKKATQLDFNYRDGFYHLGITELALGNTDLALYALLRAKTLDPIYKPALEALAVVYEKKGEVAKAQELKQVAEKL